ncbi:hypothetical protein MOO23_25585 [Rhodococcus opacus]|nr:hypothetical protein MOO23_25585 [Rhodococcus opacus]
MARLAYDLRTEFPGTGGLSQRNLVYMRTLATEYPDPIAQHPAAQLPSGQTVGASTNPWCRPRHRNRLPGRMNTQPAADNKRAGGSKP